MGRRHGHGTIRRKGVKSSAYPQVYVDKDADFASIKLAPGVESKSYARDGFVFCEDARGRVIEIQVLNLSGLKLKSGRAA